MGINCSFLFRAYFLLVLTLVQFCRLRLTEHAERMGINETDFRIFDGWFTGKWSLKKENVMREQRLNGCNGSRWEMDPT
jgi:hypothetical protein